MAKDEDIRSGAPPCGICYTVDGSMEMPDTIDFLAQAGASFVDVSSYINQHDQGALQAAVNVFHVLEGVEDS